MQREKMASRIGFLFVSAGCAIGLGNVWRFPYITGKYGGAVFVVAYLFFLLMLALPLLIMEFSVGRASQQNLGNALRVLEPKGSSWHRMGWISLVGSYLLMMFYIPVAGWMLFYVWRTATGQLALASDQMPAAFGSMLADPAGMTFWAFLTSVCCFIVCGFGLRRGIERVVKGMMTGLLVIMIGLAIRAVTLPGALEGLSFYLAPDWQRAVDAGIWSLLNDAMNQAFFTLGLGIGSMCIFGSYLGREYTIHAGIDLDRLSGYLCGHDVGFHHLPRLLRLRRGAGFRPRTDFHYPAQRVQRHVRRAFLGHFVLRVHERRRADYGDHRH